MFTGTSDPVVQVQWAKMTEEGLKTRVREGGRVVSVVREGSEGGMVVSE